MISRPRLCKECGLPADAPIHTGGHPTRTHAFVRPPRERPLLFSAPMIRALLAGTKTQTRRLLRPFPTAPLPAPSEDGPWDYLPTPGAKCAFLFKSFETEDEKGGISIPIPHCPYGVPGDRLWVRETWQYFDDSPEGRDLVAVPRERLGPAAPWQGCQAARSITWRAAYRADGEISHPVDGAARWKSPIFMPRWASRITLEVTEVRIQRLQDISEEDARAEGALFAIDEEQTVLAPELTAERNTGCSACRGDPLGISELCHDSMRGERRPFACWYATVWDSINGAGSWETNPWVWAISFRRIETNQ